MYKKSIFLIILILLFIHSCASLDPSLFKKRPEAEIESFDIESISLQDITFLFNVKIKNPYPISINLDKITSIFTINKNQLFETSTKDKLNIKANDSAMNSFTVKLKYQDIINIVKDYSEKDSLDCGIAGDIVLAIPKTGIPGIPESYTFPYKVKKAIPTIKPKISIKNFQIKKPSNDEIKKAVMNSAQDLDFLEVIKVVDKLLAGKYDEALKILDPKKLDLKFDVNFDIHMQNDTKTKINFAYFNYDFFVNKDKLIKGKTTDIQIKGNLSILRIQNSISLKSFSKSLASALFNKKGDFHLQGETAIKLPDKIKKDPVKLIVNEKGNLTIAK